MKTNSIPLTEAKARLSEYGRLAEEGQVTIVLKHHRPAFLIAPAPRRAEARPKRPGLVCGKIRIAPDFDATPGEIIKAFEGQA